MYLRVLCFFSLPFMLFAFGFINELFWTFEPISVKGNTSDESKLKFDIHIVRISRGVFAISGDLIWNYDVGDDTMVEFFIYRSKTGGDDYRLMPLGVPKQPFYDFINNVYKDVTLKNFLNCSNLPRFKGKFVPPWPKKTYTFDRCMMNGEGFPVLLPEGFYKIIGNFYGEVEWSLEFVALVMPKSY